MLRINASKSAERASGYYANSLACSDYYLEQQQIRSAWLGQGSERLGLTGEVNADQFVALCNNRVPGSDVKLTPRDGAHRRVGFDVNFHCPKSVSLAYALTNDDSILEAFHHAVDETMSDAEHMAHTLVRRDGDKSKRRTGNLVWARFTHLTARPVRGVPDPHLHAHNFVFNATWDDAEARWKAVEFTFVHEAAPILEKRFHERLVAGLKEAGYPARTLERYSELTLFSETTLTSFSRRTTEVEATAAALGIEDPKEKDKLGSRTRKAKDTTLNWEELRSIWATRVPVSEREIAIEVAFRRAEMQMKQETRQDIGREFTSKEAREETGDSSRYNTSGAESASKSKPRSSANKPAPFPLHVKDAETAIDWAIKQSFARKRTTKTESIIRRAYVESGCRLKYGELTAAMQKRQDLIRHQSLSSTFATTGDVVVEEKRILDYVEATLGRSRPVQFDPVEFLNKTLRADERNAVSHALRDMNGVTVLNGLGSIQNRAVLEELVTQISHCNMNVTILSAKKAAAEYLAKNPDAGGLSIVNHTKAWLKMKMGMPGLEQTDSVWKFLQQEKPPETASWRNRGHVVILDDAAALGLATVADVVDRCRAIEAKLIVTGDEDTVPFIGGGNVIRLLTQHGKLPHVSIDRGRAKRSSTLEDGMKAWERTNGLEKLVKDDHIIQVKPDEGMKKIADYYASIEANTRNDSPKRRKTVVVTATTPQEREDLTEKIRDAFQRNKLLGKKKQVIDILHPLDWDSAKKGLAEHYHPGQIVRFSQKTGAFRAGEEVQVLGQSQFGGVLVAREEHKLPVHLPLEKCDDFNVLKRGKLVIRNGEHIRFLAGGLTKDKKHRIEAGSVYTVKSLTRGGDIVLSNGWVVDKSYRYLEYGYVTNLSTAKVMNADLVLASGYGDKSGHTNREKFTSVMTSGRDVVYYTSSLAELKRGVTKKRRDEDLASDLVQKIRDSVQQKERDNGLGREA